MFGKKPKSHGEEISEKIDDILKQIQNDRDRYDEETKRQLKEVRDSDWHVTKYLREILWELRYARRRAERP
jgi:polyhydroxyalkanoate synthesis regulator phasin